MLFYGNLRIFLKICDYITMVKILWCKFENGEGHTAGNDKNALLGRQKCEFLPENGEN